MTLRRWVDIELPVIRAPMAGSQGFALAIAASEAGRLGFLPGLLRELAGVAR